ncbi:N-acetyltransferase [Candidatus Latescibacterota bacterium]
MKLPENMRIRKASISDVPSIGAIVNKQAETGIMLQRPLSLLYENIRDYAVIEADGEVVACGALHVMWSDLAEIRAVAVSEEHRKKGVGRALIEMLVDEAKNLGIESIFVLTYQVDFFKTLGFYDIDKSELPHKIWKDCLNCVHFPDCDEIALKMTVL